MTNFSIQDLETFSGIKKHTIRIWEQRYAFLQPKRTAALRRLYSPDELNLLLTVARLQQDGLRVSQIAKLIEKKQSNVTNSHSTKYLKAIHDLIIAMAEMDLRQFDIILQDSFDVWGLDVALQHVMLPFCDRVGLLNETDNKSYLQNVTFVKQIIKHKLCSAIEQVNRLEEKKQTAFLFLFGNEGSETGMLYLQYLIKKQGFYTLYFGNYMSAEVLFQLIDSHLPDYLISWSPAQKQQRSELLKVVNKLSTHGLQTRLLTIGKALPQEEAVRNYSHADSFLKAVEMFSCD